MLTLANIFKSVTSNDQSGSDGSNIKSNWIQFEDQYLTDGLTNMVRYLDYICFWPDSPVFLPLPSSQIGVTDPEDQQKVMNALQQMTLDKVDLDTIDQFGAADSG